MNEQTKMDKSYNTKYSNTATIYLKVVSLYSV